VRVVSDITDEIVVQAAVKRQLDDVMADIKRLSATVRQKLKGSVSNFCLCTRVVNG